MPRNSKACLDRSVFHDVPMNVRPRRIFLESASELDLEWLRIKGYDPVLLLTMPRETQGDQVAYLLAKAQGIEEGTIKVNASQRLMLVTEMQAFGLLNKQNQNLNIDLKLPADTVQSLLDWNASRHTLRGDNSTVQDLVAKKLLPVEVLTTQEAAKIVAQRKGRKNG